MVVIIRQDPEVERAAIERIVHDIYHGDHDEEEMLRVEAQLRRISLPEILEEDDDAAA
jgi:hypothetical protein